jgi:hypothetical protein
MQIRYSIETTAGLRKQRPPHSVNIVPGVSFRDKSAKAADCRVFLVTAYGEISIEHSRQPFDRNEAQMFGMTCKYSISAQIIYLPRLKHCIPASGNRCKNNAGWHRQGTNGIGLFHTLLCCYSYSGNQNHDLKPPQGLSLLLKSAKCNQLNDRCL